MVPPPRRRGAEIQKSASFGRLWIALRAKCTSFSADHRPLRVLGTIQNINARKRADRAKSATEGEGAA